MSYYIISKLELMTDFIIRLSLKNYYRKVNLLEGFDAVLYPKIDNEVGARIFLEKIKIL